MVCRPPALAPPIPPTAPHQGWQADVKGDEPVAGCKLRVAPSSSTWALSAGAKFCKLTSITQPNGSAQIFSYDAAGQLLSMVNRAPGGAVQSRFEYTYYVQGNRVSMITLDGTTRYEYDPSGQLTAEVSPDGHRVGYQYDAAGNRVRTPSTVLHACALWACRILRQLGLVC